MILMIALSLIYVEIKNLALKTFGTEITTKFWSEWELRLMLVVSLILQLVLVVSGNYRRKYIGKKLPWVAITVWLVYLSADWMATLVLSTLLRGDVKLKYGFIVYWTPFLLWHLGSPYNITAYSLEDNEMWLRHFLGMVFLVSEAIYIYIRFRSDTHLNLMAVPIFLSGVCKYGERIWALRCANDKQLINSLVPDDVARLQLQNHIRIGLSKSEIDDCFKGKGNVPRLDLLREASKSFLIFRPLFLDIPFELSAEIHKDLVYIKSKSSAEDAFKLVGTELHFLYDLLFTKTPYHYNYPKVSLSLRAFCFLSAVSSLIAFSVVVMVREKSVHSKVDIVITYLLLLGAISLDVYSFIMYAFSKWAMTIPQNKVHRMFSRVAAHRLKLIEIKSMAQHDLINYLVKAKRNKLFEAVRIIDTGNLLQNYWYTKWEPIDCELKQFIFDQLKDKRQKWETDGCRHEDLDKLLNAKGESILDPSVFEDLDWGTNDFSKIIFTWHLATDLVYYDDVDRFRRGRLGPFCKIAKCLSDYMMYLVLVRPKMLPKGFTEVINKVSYAKANVFFPKEMRRRDPSQVRKKFTTAVLGHKDLLHRRNSIDVIQGGLRFADKLQSLVADTQWDHEEKWEMISKVWVEMMAYGASHCSWKEHAQQLRHGGELLTHVALLMAHLGLSTQIRIDKTLDDEDNQPNLPFFLPAED